MRYSADTFEAQKFLGNQAGRSKPNGAFLRKISCMDIPNRELFAFLEMIKEIGKARLTKTQTKRLESLQKLFQLWGYAKFPMDQVSHLSMISNIDEEVFSGH